MNLYIVVAKDLFYRRPRNLNDARGGCGVGGPYTNGIGVIKDHATAAEYLDRACKPGDNQRAQP